MDPSPSLFLDAPSSHTIGDGENLLLNVSAQHESEDLSVVFRSTRPGLSTSEGLYVDYQEPFEYPSEAIDQIDPGLVTAQALVRVEGDVVETISHALEIIDSEENAGSGDDDEQSDSGNDSSDDSSDDSRENPKRGFKRHGAVGSFFPNHNNQ